MDSPIHGEGVTVRALFERNSFALDYYQREYTWTRHEVGTLIDDLSRRFLDQWDPLRENDEVGDYAPYFLGPYVYHESDGRTFLVDGQQRVTTLHLLLIYLRQLLLDQEKWIYADELEGLTYTARHGKRSFKVGSSEELARAQLLNSLVTDWNGLKGFTLPEDAHVSVRNLHDRSREIDEDFPERLRDEALVPFVRWLLDRVCLVGIRALDQENGREIFVSMNDRGLRLSHVDLLKGHLFRRVSPRAREELGRAWADMLARLTTAETDSPDAGTPSAYVRSFLLARYAHFDEASADAAEIGRAAHEWILRNEVQLGLDHPAGARDFVERLTEVSERYCVLLRARQDYRPDLAAVFFNGYNGIDDQFTLLLSVVSPDDTDAVFLQKCSMAAAFLDLVYVRRCVNNLPVQRRDLDQIVRRLIPLLRICRTADDVAAVLGRETSLLEYDFREIVSFGLRANNRRLVRYLLARMTAHVQRACEGGDHDYDFLQGRRDYEIEHIWANRFERYRAEVETTAEFHLRRNRLGALLLLPKSVNASFRDDPYERKLEHYYAENRLAASLHPKSRLRNTPFTKYLKASGLDSAFRPCPEFGVREIELRQHLYRLLCEEIWNPDRLGFRLPVIGVPAERPTARRRYGVEVTDLIAAGLIPPNAKIFRTVKGEVHFATVEEDGTIRLDTGQPFPSLSAAGAAVAGTRACAGWDVWRIERDGVAIPLKRLREEAINRGLVTVP
ncbi:hypothetical protein FHS43_003420 [Streptosporangium becharense]|uniref:DUF262 domain-containing protein n=1 Tax=Streptosporangium becharense TaxID=1816182 RepID=A0A7W9IDI4_9ACTN|nr:DUF262 domain-containing protein [Streptosporangium becharense]MBB2912140.1 hypothetical protein [Streptosporangium becharense]MBB5818687.1 hypothetical protein [Streptosporangium becharense]